MGYKRATGSTGMAGVYTGNMIASKGNKSASEGSDPSGKSHAKGNMGTKSGSARPVSQSGDPSGFAAGRARTNKGKNHT